MMIADMHLHLYPVYDREAALRGCVQRLAALAPATASLACLTERHDCHAYKALLETAAAESGMIANPRYQVLENGRCVAFRPGGGLPPLFVLPGRQIATRERLEVLCIGSDAAIPDGEPAELTIRRIGELDALPVLAWAVGKWLFGRRRIVDKLLETFVPDKLLIGDSAMRPVFWPEPAPMRAARRRQYRLLAGSDPLPRAGDERQAGRYATRVDAAFDPQAPARSLLTALATPSTPVRRLGSRCGLLEFPGRMR